MSENPFDLTKLVVAGGLVEKHKYKPDTYTPEEKKDMLNGFVRVPREKWLQLEIGAHIRYERKTGDMRKGGYVQYIDPKGEYIMVSVSNVGYQSRGWKLPLVGVSEIWRERATASVPTSNVVPTIIDDKDKHIAALEEDIRKLKIEIQRVMDQQKRIIISVGKNAVRLDRIMGTGRRQ
jgi:hypothetical protein